MNGWAMHIWPLAFLIVAVADDLLFRKFHNSLFIGLGIIAALYGFFLSPLSLQDSLLGFFVGGLLLLPLVLLRAIGAGDMKFMMVFGLLLGAAGIFSVFIYSILWGGCIGLFKSLLSGHLKIVILNVFQMFKKQKPVTTVNIPYTVAILFGWLTWVQIGGVL